MARRTPVATYVIASVLSIAAASCSKSRDAVIFNPCSVPASVSHGSPVTNQWFDVTAIPPNQGEWLPRYVTEPRDYLKVAFGSENGTVLDVSTPSEGPVVVA